MQQKKQSLLSILIAITMYIGWRKCWWFLKTKAPGPQSHQPKSKLRCSWFPPPTWMEALWTSCIWWMFRAVFPNINGCMDLREPPPKFPAHSGPWVVLQGHVWTHSIHAPVGRLEMLQKFTNTASIYIKHKHYIIYWKRWFSKMQEKIELWTAEDLSVYLCVGFSYKGAFSP